MEANENKDACSKCKGKCCKKSGCDYSADDFEDKNFLYLKEVLDTKKISIVSIFNPIRTKNGYYNNPILYMRARNLGRGPVDLFSFKTTCSALTESGCEYLSDQRPSGGKNLVPDLENGCYPKIDPFEILKTWYPYQSVLRKLVKFYKNKSVDKVWEDDAYEVFVQILLQNFNGISKVEIEDMLSGIQMVAECYPDAYEKARSYALHSPCYNLLNKR